MSEDDPPEEMRLRERIAEHPRPALAWSLGVVALVAVEFGALADLIVSLPVWNDVASYVPSGQVTEAVAAAAGTLADLPTLLSRDLFPNQGYHLPGEGWQGTLLGLPPAIVWAFRLVLVYAYATLWLWWIWRGYLVFRRHYRPADWTPRDDMVDRFSNHAWGLFGLLVVFAFVVMAVFAPTLGPATLEGNIVDPYSNQITYYDEASGSVANISAGFANLDTGSTGNPQTNVGPLTYDQYGRYHPFGTLPSGKDLFTFMVFGARVSLFIGIVAMGIAALLATAFALVTAYYKGLVDLTVVIAGDSIQALPLLLVLILLSVVMRGTWIAGIYNGAFLLALILGVVQWPYLWRAVRGPAFQVAEQEWIDAAKSYGQRPAVTMRKHMFPYIVGYLFVYTSMTLGGIIIAVAGLSFLGLGISSPTPEWGRAISLGQQYVASVSWHISLLPGLLIVLVVTAFNALGDGIRDAIDPESGAGAGEGAEAAAAGGGGA